jgi:very-short-patch-repair endonuclease
VSTVACQALLPLPAAAPTLVWRISGVTSEQLAVVLDPPPAGAPVVLRLRPAVHSSAPMIVGDVLDQLESVAGQLLPGWLPEADRLDGVSDLDRRVVRMLARRRASVSEHFGPFLADLAESALLGRTGSHRHAPQIRARGLVRVLCEAYRRDGIALLVEALPHDRDEACWAGAFQWLASHGIAVWLLGDVLPTIDRFPTFAVAGGQPDAAEPAAGSARVDFPALPGRPHPRSRTEQALEAALARCAWAVGRDWNRVHQTHRLARPIRVELMWPDLGCVVELDGPDHRSAAKYADDRRRDNTLVVDGFAMLRFTNEEIADDMSRVLGIIEQVLMTRRGGRTNP